MQNILSTYPNPALHRRHLTFSKKGRRPITFTIDKRQKFVISVIILSLGLFFTEFQFGKSGVYITTFLSVFTDLFVFWAMRRDMTEKGMYAIFILPFFYSLAFGLFYFLVPARLIFRIILAVLYAFGLYSLLLSQNIFIVASIRTIALLSGARIVSFVITLISFFFLSNIIFSLHQFIILEVVLVSLYSYLLAYHAVWTYTLGKYPLSISKWVFGLSLCCLEVAAALWFWPSSPTVLALFMTGFFYIIVGLSHVWLEKRLFRSILWEYLWVATIVLLVLNIFTAWGK